MQASSFNPAFPLTTPDVLESLEASSVRPLRRFHRLYKILNDLTMLFPSGDELATPRN